MKFYQAPVYSNAMIELLDERNMGFPFTCDYMRYDGAKQQYIPTYELIMQKGIRLMEVEPTDRNNALERISDQIYKEIARNNGTTLRGLKCMIAKGISPVNMSPFRFRLAFMDILWRQADFYVINNDPERYVGAGMEHSNIYKSVQTDLDSLGLRFAGSYDNSLLMHLRREDW